MQKILNHLLSIAPLIALIICVCAIAYRAFGGTAKEEPVIITTSTLTDAIDISELSTAQFTYNGIAEIYKDADKGKVACHIRYYATVKAGIDMNDVKWKIDDTDKTVTPTLPEIRITANPVDEKKLSFIPSNYKGELNEVLKVCREDAEQEAMESTE